MNDSVSQESIAAAKAHQQQERARIEAVTGVHIGDDGRPRLVGQHCHKPGCLYVVFRESAEAAQRSISTHYSLKHGLSLVGR